MSYIYITEHGAWVSVESNRIVIQVKRLNLLKSVPIEGVENITIVGNASFSDSCMREFLKRGIQLTWLSSTGSFFGKLINTENTNVTRQLAQFSASQDEAFRLELAKKWITSKIKNQTTLLRRYMRIYPQRQVTEYVNAIILCQKNIEKADCIAQLMGHEGNAAKNYFAALSILTEYSFRFEGRSRRPPKDKFNALLSFCYTLLLYDFFTIATNRGLNPYISLMHSPRNGHPALCSDLMEEWRAVIVDSMVMGMIHTGKITDDDFEPPAEAAGVFLKHDSLKKVINEYESKVRTKAKYLDYADFPVSFRRAFDMQTTVLAQAIENRDASIYKGVVIR